MKRKISILKIHILLLLFVQFGCSAHSIKSISHNTNLNTPIYNCNSQNSTCAEVDTTELNTSYDIQKRIKGKIIANQSCIIKYHKMSSTSGNIVVEGKLGISNESYPVVLDTGASQPIIVNNSFVKQNRLPVYNIGSHSSDINSNKLGLCKLPELNIGGIILADWSGIYLKSYAALSFFGIPIATSSYNNDNIILGLPLLREFKYIKLDNLNKETELSYSKSFVPSSEYQWKRYSISIEEDFHSNVYLFVRITIEGEEVELQIDTGSGRGLAIGERLWSQVGKKINSVILEKGKDYYPYIGNLSCKKGIIPKMEFGSMNIRNAEISVFNDNNPLLNECDGLIGMQYFLNKVIILDFEHELMWLR
jgi:hypothetical protein